MSKGRESVLTFETDVQHKIELRDGPSAVHTFVHDDPMQRFGIAFNHSAVDIKDRYIEQVFLRPQVVLAKKVTQGEITTFPELLSSMSAVLVVTALKYRTTSFRRDNPLLKSRQKDCIGMDTSRPLIVHGVDLERLASRIEDPAQFAEADELRQDAIVNVNRLPFVLRRVYISVRRMQTPNGSNYGAFRDVSRRAVLDARNRIADILPESISSATLAEPADEVIRQVRKLYRIALEQLLRWKRERFIECSNAAR
jgi:hypothetical protein